MATPEPLSFRKVLSDSRLIIRLHQHHFQALAVLFLFPISVCALLYPAIQKNLISQSEQSSSFQTHTLFQAFSSNGFLHLNQTPYLYVLLSLLYSLFVNLFFLFAVASISYSTYHLSLDEPVDLTASIKSILYSFWPLVSTILVVCLIEVLTAIPFVLLVLLVFKWLHHTSYFIPFVMLISLILVVVLIYLSVNWMLAFVVVVVESKWGYAPLERSAYLVKGNRGVALSMLLYFWLFAGIFLWSFQGTTGSGGWWFLLLMIIGSLCLTQISLLSYVAQAVLYVYCRESREGLPLRNSEKFPLLK